MNMVETHWHFDDVVVGWNTPELRMKTCEVLDLTKKVDKVVYCLSLAVPEVQFQVCKEWKGIEVNIHCTAFRNDFIWA